jgi:apolipoprotein D and lipocalin family protein
MGQSASSLPPLQTAAGCETAKFMGSWFVIAVKPTYFERTNSNAVEKYEWLQSTDPKTAKSGGPWAHDIAIDFTYNKNAPLESPLSSIPQKGWIQGEDKSNSSEWKVSPMWPIKMPYLILEVDEVNYEYTVIGYPSRAYCWIMSRHPQMSEATYKMLKDRLVEKHKYNLDSLRKVPQVWTKVEREKRGLTEKEIPDSMLVSSDATTTK